MGTRVVARAALFAVVASFLLAGPARASLVFTTPSGSVVGSDGRVSAEADFTLGTGTIDITLKNLEAGIHTSGQAISGLLFSIDISSTPKAKLTPDKATLRKFTKKGDPGFKDKPDSKVTRWDVFKGAYADGVKNTSSYTLDALTAGKPQQLVIGDGLYPKRPDGSLFDHSEFSALSETFHLKIKGVTASTEISDVVFQFGKVDGKSDHLVKAVDPLAPPTVPEPSSLAIAGLGVLGFLAYGLRRQFVV
jgi:hypothetical protein